MFCNNKSHPVMLSVLLFSDSRLTVFVQPLSWIFNGEKAHFVGIADIIYKFLLPN